MCPSAWSTPPGAAPSPKPGCASPRSATMPHSIRSLPPAARCSTTPPTPKTSSRTSSASATKPRPPASPARNFPGIPRWPVGVPALLWNGMIAPLTPLPIRGVIWYQGESNSALERWPLYDRIMRTLIEDWRRQWGVGAFPFLYVQISNFKSSPLEDWASLREQQFKTLGAAQHRHGRHHRHRQPRRRPSHRQAHVGHRLARPRAPSPTANRSSTPARCSERPLPRAHPSAPGSIMHTV